jgi:hypothetical protein
MVAGRGSSGHGVDGRHLASRRAADVRDDKIDAAACDIRRRPIEPLEMEWLNQLT